MYCERAKEKEGSPLLWFTGLDTGLLHSQGTTSTIKFVKHISKGSFINMPLYQK